MVDATLAVIAIFGLVLAWVTYVSNGTPMQLGPAPFFGGILTACVAAAWIVARHLVWQ